ncbi:MAG: sulfotransferase family protein [Actinomycetota bacterium]
MDRSDPFFVVGCGRSGTTILRLMFNAHPEVAIPPESHFIARLVASWPRMITADGVDADAIVALIGHRLDHMEIDRDVARARLRDLRDRTPRAATEAIFGIVTERAGKPRWADKTPVHVEEMATIAGVFPRARFVHIIRDGRDVALSFMERPFGPSDVWSAARLWDRMVRAGIESGAELGRERYREVRYERLVASPQGTLAELCRFVELDPRPEMLSFFERGGSDLTASERGNHPNVARPLTPGLRDWRTAMAPADVEAFEAVAGPLLSDLGYERRFPNRSRAFAVKAFVEMRRRDVKAGRVVAARALRSSNAKA